MEEIITKDNLDTYTQGLKGVLSSMGEAINNAGSSSAGEEITITVTNISGNAHVDVKSGDTMIQSITSDGTSTVTIPFGMEYTIMGYDSTGLYVGGGVRAVANKMSSSISVDCTAVDGVDLGLPSGKIWATKNVGATSATDTGSFFVHGGRSNSYGYDYWMRIGNSSTGGTKYEVTTSNTYTSGDPVYDAARVNMGGDWRVPTIAEVKELINNCTLSSVLDYDSYPTVTLTGQNGNSIVFKHSYYRYGTSNTGGTGNIWFRTCNASGWDTANNSYNMYSYVCQMNRYNGYIYIIPSNYAVPVRAIRDGSV